MKTIYAAMTEDCLDAAAVREAGEILKRGGLVAFPTETVYGLGGDALNPESSRKIYAAKGRPSDNPLIVHIAKLSDAEKIAEELPESFYRLGEAFWPGPLTIIVKKKAQVPMETTGGLGTVAIRYPSHKVAQAIIEAAGGFVAAPSANRSGRPSPTLAEHCRQDLDGLVDMIVDGGAVGIGLESTIIDLTDGAPTMLRPGYVTREMLDEVLGTIEIDQTIFGRGDGARPKAPGMKYRHYAPKGDLTIVTGPREKVTEYINARCREAMAAGKKTGVICTEESAASYKADRIYCAGTRDNEEKTAHELFRILRDMDEEEIPVIYSEAFSGEGIGMAVMNRLRKAAGGQIIEL